MRIVSWNVNSIRARLPRVLDWLEEWKPDVLCVQETKVLDGHFPREEFEARGYHLDVFGQKTYNGVALIGRQAPDEVVRGLPDDSEEADKRLIGGRYGELWIWNAYVPNGTELGTPRFDYKLEWFRRMRALLERRHHPGDQVMICGDFNVAPDDRDVYDPKKWRGRLHFHPDEHAVLAHLMEWGLVDALRTQTEEGGIYSWWDYRSGAFHRGWGLRIDLALVTPALAARIDAVRIDREARKGPKPSDHAPVIVDLTP